MAIPRASQASRRWPGHVPAGICAAFGVAAFAALLSGWSASVAFPAGPLGQMALTIDPVAAAFFALFLATTAVIWSASPPTAEAAARAAAICLAMLAGDPFTLALGVAGGTGRAGSIAAGMLVVASGVATGLGAMLLTLSGAIVILLSGGVGAIPLAAYLLVRDLLGAADSGVWWGAIVMAAGGAITLSGGWLALDAMSLPGIVRHATGGAAGMVVVAIGAAILARGVDLGAAATWALASALLMALAATISRAILIFATETIADGAGTSVIFRLGGMIGRMPVVAYATLFAAAVLSLLPPGPGFAAAWLLVHSLLALCRSGGFAMPALVIATALAAALGLGACAAALWRLVAVALLGQPRTPRAAAAEPRPVATGRALLAFVATLSLAGLLPGLAIRVATPAASVALGPVAAGGLAQREGVLTLTASAEAHGYSPLGVAALLVVGAILVSLVAKRSASVRREAPAWADGFASPPWLPFGEPAAQVSANAFRLLPMLPTLRLPRLPTIRVRMSARRQTGALLGVALAALTFEMLR